MKFLSLYILRSLGISIGIAVVATFSLTMLPIPGRRGSVDRMAISLILASVFFMLQMVTMPYLVYRKGTGKVSAEDIHNEQLKLLEAISAFGRRHRTMIVVGFIALLIGLVLVDSFRG